MRVIEGNWLETRMGAGCRGLDGLAPSSPLAGFGGLFFAWAAMNTGANAKGAKVTQKSPKSQKSFKGNTKICLVKATQPALAGKRSMDRVKRHNGFALKINIINIGTAFFAVVFATYRNYRTSAIQSVTRICLTSKLTGDFPTWPERNVNMTKQFPLLSF